MGETARREISPEDFLIWCLDQEDRYELVDGFPVKMMAGASNYHDVIVVNVLASLHAQLRGTPCRAATPDTAVRTKIKGLRRPDVTVTCGEPKPDSYEAYTPRMVVEVLSKTNAGIGWERKLDEYRRLSGLAYLLLIDSREPKATLYTRKGETWEPLDSDDLDGAFALPDIGCRLAMRDIFEGLAFEGEG